MRQELAFVWLLGCLVGVSGLDCLRPRKKTPSRRGDILSFSLSFIFIVIGDDGTDSKKRGGSVDPFLSKNLLAETNSHKRILPAHEHARWRGRNVMISILGLDNLALSRREICGTADIYTNTKEA